MKASIRIVHKGQYWKWYRIGIKQYNLREVISNKVMSASHHGLQCQVFLPNGLSKLHSYHDSNGLTAVVSHFHSAAL